MRQSFLFALFIATFLSLPAFCKMEQVFVQILRPAAVTLPDRIQNIVLADRRCGYCLHRADGLRKFSGPDTSVYSTLAGLKKQLLSTGRYSVSLAALDTALLAYETEQLLPPLSFEAATKITANDPATLLIVLEKLWQEHVFERWITHYVWRVYDPSSKTVLDEFDQKNENVTGIRIPEERNADVIYSPAIYLYACHIMPHWEWVDRDYYTEGSRKMRDAALYAQNNEWDSAAVLWNVVANDSANKTARSEACYNLAVYYEFAGDFDKALEWIALAEKLGDRQAEKYAPLIRRRKTESALTNAQIAAKQGQLPVPNR
jgi:hypothetical protein